MNVEIAERLAARRKLAGLSQEALAEKLGVSRQAVSKWERSESSGICPIPKLSNTIKKTLFIVSSFCQVFQVKL